jgi:hypothetical protein
LRGVDYIVTLGLKRRGNIPTYPFPLGHAQIIDS